jgi:hypothetical protein
MQPAVPVSSDEFSFHTSLSILAGSMARCDTPLTPLMIPAPKGRIHSATNYIVKYNLGQDHSVFISEVSRLIEVLKHPAC